MPLGVMQISCYITLHYLEYLENFFHCFDAVSRMTIDARGGLSFRHVPDASFDVNDYVLDLKTQKSWGDVYWKLWGTVNYLACTRCGETFPCCELAWCRYHPEAPVYEDSSCSGKRAYGEYPCCGTRIARFDPTLLNKVSLI